MTLEAAAPPLARPAYNRLWGSTARDQRARGARVPTRLPDGVP